MLNIFSRGLAKCGAGLALALALTSPTQADPAKPTKLRGTILSVQGDLVSARSQDGSELKIALEPATRIVAIVPPRSPGSSPAPSSASPACRVTGEERLALEVHIFPRPCVVPAKGERPWDKGPGSRMTNATVADVAGVQGQDLTLKFHGGVTKIKVTPRTKIVSLVLSDRHDLKPGNQFIAFALLDAKGVYEPRAINVGRDGFTPPM